MQDDDIPSVSADYISHIPFEQQRGVAGFAADTTFNTRLNRSSPVDPRLAGEPQRGSDAIPLRAAACGSRLSADRVPSSLSSAIIPQQYLCEPRLAQAANSHFTLSSSAHAVSKLDPSYRALTGSPSNGFPHAVPLDSRTPPPHVTPFPTIATTLLHPIRRRNTSHSTHSAAHPPGPLVLVLPVIDLVFPSPFPFPDPAIRQSPPKRACGFSNFDLQQQMKQTECLEDKVGPGNRPVTSTWIHFRSPVLAETCYLDHTLHAVLRLHSGLCNDRGLPVN